jgi:hypothetical protein
MKTHAFDLITGTKSTEGNAKRTRVGWCDFVTGSPSVREVIERKGENAGTVIDRVVVTRDTSHLRGRLG